MSTTLGYLVGQAGEFSGVRVAIPETGLIIGRDPSQVDVVFRHTMVSRRHAQIAPDKKGRLYLIDLESRNGTCVNGRKITAPVPLSVGDKVDFGSDGKVVFVFESAATPSVTGILNQIFGENVASVDWKVGDTILDTYEVLGVLGQGGFGKVYKVRHKSWNVDLAVKSPLPKLFSDEKAVEDFVREAETWVSLNLHPNIVQCFYVRTIGGIPRIFAEFVPGGSLHNWIEKGKLTQLDRILDAAIQFAWGLHAAHEQGLVHQDVKPLNVLMMPDGTAKVSDFGLARARRVTGGSVVTGPDNMVTMAGMFTPAYCSPEQAQHLRLSRKTDMWSFAVSLLHMFAGKLTWRHGFQAAKALEEYQRVFGPKLAVKMPKQLANLLAHCFRSNPDDRPKDLQEIAGELQEIYREAVGAMYPRSEPREVEHQTDSLNNRAISLLDLGCNDEALVTLERAIHSEPNHAEVIYNRGLLLWRSGRMTDEALLAALTDAEKQELPSNKWRAKHAIGLVHLERADRHSARDALMAVEQHARNAPEVSTLLRQLAHLRNSAECIRTFEGHEGAVYCAAISSDWRLCLSGGQDKTLRLWECETGRCMHTFERGKKTVNCVAFSPDGQLGMSGDEKLHIWSLATGKEVRTGDDDMISVHAVAFLPDGRQGLTGSYDDTIRLWDLASGRCVRRFEGHTDRVDAIEVSPNKRLILTGSGDRTLRLWEIQTGECVQVMQVDPSAQRLPTRGYEWVTSVALSHNGRWALSASVDKIIRLWDLETGKHLNEFRGHTGSVFSVAFSPDDRQVLSGGDLTLRVWDSSTGRCMRTLTGHTGDVRSVAFMRAGSLGLSASADGTLKLWRLPGNLNSSPFILCRPRNTVEHDTAAREFSASLKSAKAAIERSHWREGAAYIKAARQCDGFATAKEALDAMAMIGRHGARKRLNGGWCARVLEGHAASVGWIGLIKSGQQVLTLGADGFVRFWDFHSGRCLQALKWPPVLVRLMRYAFSQDGCRALIVSTDSLPGTKTIRLWDLVAGRCVQAIKKEMGGVFSAAISPDCRWALLGSNREILLVNLVTGNCVRALEGHSSSVSSIAVSADWQRCVSAAYDKTLRVWDLATGQTLSQSVGHTTWIDCVALSACGNWVLSGSSDKTLRLWEAATGKCVRTFEGHTGVVRTVAISSDGRWGLSGSSDKTVRLWELASGLCQRCFEAHAGGVNAVAFSPDTRWALSGGHDNTVRVWELDWEYEFPEFADWDDGATPYLVTFLTSRRPFASDGLSRIGKPSWTEGDFQELLSDLQNSGYGWLRPEGVRRELERMAADWERISR